MTKKTSVRKPRSAKKKATTPGKKIKQTKNNSPLLRSIAGFFLLIAIVVSTFFIVHIILPPDNVRKADPDYSAYEVFPVVENHITTSTPPVNSSELPVIALNIDDIGYNRSIAKKFAELDKNFTFSILPNSPHKRSIALDAHKKGVEIMLHLPMEPFEYPKVNPGPGALLVSMTPAELTAQLESYRLQAIANSSIVK